MKSRSRKIVKSAKPKQLKQLERRMIVDKLGLRCNWCNVYTDNSIYANESPRKTTIDHLYNRLDPMRKGNDDKVVIACEACNAMRARIHEFVFGQRKFPIKYALEIEETVVVEAPQRPKPKKHEYKPTVLNPVIRGPKIIIDVPREPVVPPTRWERVKAWFGKVWSHLTRKE